VNREERTSTKVVQLLEPANVTATGRSAYVDLQGWDAVDIILDYGDVTAAAGANNLVPTLQEADATPAASGSYSAVASADLGGSFTTLEDGVTADVDHVAYRGSERYIHVLLTETGTAAAVVGVIAVLRKFSRQPSNDVNVTTGTVT